MKTIEVVTAIITDSDKIFATHRGYGEFKDWWEYIDGEYKWNGTDNRRFYREE